LFTLNPVPVPGSDRLSEPGYYKHEIQYLPLPIQFHLPGYSEFQIEGGLSSAGLSAACFTGEGEYCV